MFVCVCMWLFIIVALRMHTPLLIHMCLSVWSLICTFICRCFIVCTADSHHYRFTPRQTHEPYMSAHLGYTLIHGSAASCDLWYENRANRQQCPLTVQLESNVMSLHMSIHHGRITSFKTFCPHKKNTTSKRPLAFHIDTIIPCYESSRRVTLSD